MTIIENDFLNKLKHYLKKYTIEQYITYSLDSWIEYVNTIGLIDESMIDHIMDRSNKDSIEEFINEFGILNLQYTEDKILKRYIVGFDFDISLRIQKDITFRNYFDLYKDYLVKNALNNSLKLKLLISLVSRKINIVPKLATLDTIENDSEKVGYNIYYSDGVSESLAINIRQDLDSDLVVLSENRGIEEEIIEEEIEAIYELLSQGLFQLIIHDNYPKILESILPEKMYIKQIKDRILKKEAEVKYGGQLYRSIKLKDSYVIVDSEMHAVDDEDIAEAIYCKINLSKSMFI